MTETALDGLFRGPAPWIERSRGSGASSPPGARRQQIIAANPELQERELIKLASLAGAVAEALRLRGVDDPAAILTAEAAITVFRVAFERWVDQANRQPLQRLTRESLRELRAITAA
jgi:hypothetical protein